MSAPISSTPTSDGSWGVVSPDSSQLLYPPEPQNALSSWLRAAGAAVSTVGSGVASAVDTAVDQAKHTAEMQALLILQMQMQQEMQIYSMQSNVLRTQHETDMTPIRNIRLG